MTRGLRSDAVDGFCLEYDLVGAGPDVLLLHGWPGERGDYRAVVPLLEPHARLVVPDLRGFGGSDRHLLPPAQAYSAAAQARSLLGLLDELGIGDAVVVGYDIGSRLAQQLVADVPARVRALVVTPPLPGAGTRVLEPAIVPEFWYQGLHRSPLPEALLDGRPDAVRSYLGYLWEHWSGPGFALSDVDLDRLVGRYARQGAFVSSIGWYRSRAGSVAAARQEAPPDAADRIPVPTEVLWPGHDALFPAAWSDRLGEWFADAHLTLLPDAGHFVPLEDPRATADAVLRALARS